MSDLPALLVKKIAERMDRASKPVPVGVSSRHLHMNQADWDVLFGGGASPSKFRDLIQPGFWAANETVSLVGPRGRIDKVRIVAPHREKTQIELSATDAARLGVSPPVRDSGDVAGSAAITVVGPKGQLELKQGVILARRHIHFHPSEVGRFGLKDGDYVRVRAGVGGDRELVFEKVLIRVSEKFKMEFHVDTDEANAAMVKTGDRVYIV